MKCGIMSGKKVILALLWHAIDHESGKVLAIAIGSRKDEVFVQLKALLKPFRITRFYTDDWGANFATLTTNTCIKLANKILKR